MREFRGRGRGSRGWRGRGRANSHPARGGNHGDSFYEDRQGMKRPFAERDEDGRSKNFREERDDNGWSNNFREEREEIHPDLLSLKKFLTEMKTHWHSNKIDAEEEELMVSNVTKQMAAKVSLLTKSEAYHLNCNVAEFLSKSKNPDILAKFMQAFDIERVEPQHKIIKIFEALIDRALDFVRDPLKFDKEDLDETTEHKEVFLRWLHLLGLHVMDNLDKYLQEESLFTQRIITMLCGKKFSKDFHDGIDPETTILSDDIEAVRDRYFRYITKEADIAALVADQNARFVLAISVKLGASLKLEKFMKRLVKHLFGEKAGVILCQPESFIVVDAVLRHCSEFGLTEKCSRKILELADEIVDTNPGIVTGMIAGINDKDKFVELYETLSPKLTLSLLTKNAELAKACVKFDMKQNDFLDKLYSAMQSKESEEKNLIFLVRNLGLGLTFKVVCSFKAHQRIVKALEELSPEELVNLACSSHVNLLESIVASMSIGEKVKLKMLSALMGRIEKIAIDKFGSRLLDAVIIHCQVKTIKTIATELLKHKRLLIGDRIGKFIFLHWGLKYLEDDNKGAWNDVLNNSRDRKRQKLQSFLERS